MPLKVFLLDDHALFRDLMAVKLKQQLRAEIIGTYSSSEELLANLAVAKEADVGLLDVRLGNSEAFEIVPALQQHAPSTKLVWVTSIVEDALIHRALNAGLPGFVHKEDPVEELVTAVQRVAAGEVYMSPAIRNLREQLFSRSDMFDKILSPREQEILKIIGSGFGNEEAASLLGLSAQTVKAHRRNIMARLELHSAAELQAYAVRRGFVQSQSLRGG